MQAMAIDDMQMMIDTGIMDQKEMKVAALDMAVMTADEAIMMQAMAAAEELTMADMVQTERAQTLAETFIEEITEQKEAMKTQIQDLIWELAYGSFDSFDNGLYDYSLNADYGDHEYHGLT
jgi:hypothetical protein